jgi:hypothetical protein
MMDWSESSSVSNWLEGGVCTTCAPGDQEKSIDDKCEWSLFLMM